MKPFLGINLTTNKKNEEINGSEFIIEKPSVALVQSLENTSKNAIETMEKCKLPLFARIIEWLCGIIGVILVTGISKAMVGEDSISLGQAYQNASWMFWLAGACLAVSAIIIFVGVRKEKSVLEAEESEQVFANIGDISDAIFAELGVPSTAKDVDILSFYYSVKGEKIKLREKDTQLAPYTNCSFYAFADSRNLYLVDSDGKYAFSLDSVKKINTVKKDILIDEWLKDEEYNKGIYKKYKLSEVDFGCIVCKYYHILEIEHNGEIWGIYFPCYELPIFEELTDLKADVVYIK